MTDHTEPSRLYAIETAQLDAEHLMVSCIDWQGQTSVWLMRMSGHGLVDVGVSELVWHEQTGPLPAIMRERVTHASYRCHRPRRDGRPCRVEVSRAGESCRHHGAALGTAARPRLEQQD